MGLRHYGKLYIKAEHQLMTTIQRTNTFQRLILKTCCCSPQRWIQDFRRGGDNPNFGAKAYYLSIFWPKLHENERNWTEKGARPSPPPATRSDQPMHRVTTKLAKTWHLRLRALSHGTAINHRVRSQTVNDTPPLLWFYTDSMSAF